MDLAAAVVEWQSLLGPASVLLVELIVIAVPLLAPPWRSSKVAVVAPPASTAVEDAA